MSYSTDFAGFFKINPPLLKEQVAYLQKFAEIRHMKRDNKKLVKIPDPEREAVNLPLGQEGEFFVAAQGFAGQDRDASILEYNYEPSTQPGLWCQWLVSDDGAKLEWNGAEKFYCYEEWMNYMMTNFIIPWGRTLDGMITWQGEDKNDIGTLVCLPSETNVKSFSGPDNANAAHFYESTVQKKRLNEVLPDALFEDEKKMRI